MALYALRLESDHLVPDIGECRCNYLYSSLEYGGKVWAMPLSYSMTTNWLRPQYAIDMVCGYIPWQIAPVYQTLWGISECIVTFMPYRYSGTGSLVKYSSYVQSIQSLCIMLSLGKICYRSVSDLDKLDKPICKAGFLTLLWLEYDSTGCPLVSHLYFDCLLPDHLGVVAQ